jgi:hypothetical protein
MWVTRTILSSLSNRIARCHHLPILPDIDEAGCVNVALAHCWGGAVCRMNYMLA